MIHFESSPFDVKFFQVVDENLIVKTKAPISTTDFRQYYLELAKSSLRNLLPMHEDKLGKRTNNFWIEIANESNPREFRTSRKCQPLHTDGAYSKLEESVDISFFFCTKQADLGGETVFIEIEKLIELMEKYEPKLLESVSKNYFTFSKIGSSKICRIIDLERKEINWNYYRCDKSTNSKIVEDFNNFLNDFILHSFFIEKILLQPGEAVFFKDKKVLHGRKSFFGNRHLTKGGLK